MIAVSSTRQSSANALQTKMVSTVSPPFSLWIERRLFLPFQKNLRFTSFTIGYIGIPIFPLRDTPIVQAEAHVVQRLLWRFCECNTYVSLFVNLLVSCFLHSENKIFFLFFFHVFYLLLKKKKRRKILPFSSICSKFALKILFFMFFVCSKRI